MTTVIIKAPGASTGANLSAPISSTRIGSHLANLINVQNPGFDSTDIVMGLPTGQSIVNLTSIGRYPNGSGSLWRLANGTSSSVEVSLDAHGRTFRKEFQLDSGFDTYVISPIGGSGPLTHTLVNGSRRIPKAASNTNPLTNSARIEATDNYRIFGTEYDDALTGSSGNDSLIGALGSDILVGSSGNDRFIYEPEHITDAGVELDTITDFTIGNDKIVLDGLNFSSVSFASSLGGTVLRNNGLDFALVEGVTLTASDFIIV